jgi:hypothetical protein
MNTVLNKADKFVDYSVMGTVTLIVLMFVGLYMDRMFDKLSEYGRMYEILSIPIQVGTSLFIVELYLTFVFSNVSALLNGKERETLGRLFLSTGILSNQPGLTKRVKSLFI